MSRRAAIASSICSPPSVARQFRSWSGSTTSRIRQSVSDAAGSGPAHRTIYRIWPDFPVRALINKSIATVKADAARNSFSALGEGIVWAVVDSGIDAKHRHFDKHRNLDLDPATPHRDFTRLGDKGDPFDDADGHGTHVAGIIAGEMAATKRRPGAGVLASPRRARRHRLRPCRARPRSPAWRPSASWSA